MRKKNTSKNKYTAGFSLVEFIVVLVIFSIMSSVSLFNYSEYSRSISQTNVAQDIALAVRQAQVYGISASNRNIDNIDINSTIPDITRDQSIRGVYINAGNNSLIIFEDINRNNRYDDTGTVPDRIIDVRAIQASGVDINGVDICAASNGVNCGNIVNEAHISFQRPYPDAYIYSDAGVRYDVASIVIGDGSQNTKYIEINSIGNISVKNYE